MLCSNLEHIMSKPRILITNDDGVYAAGLLAAYNSVKELGDVTIVAPSVQRSGVGRSISIFEPLRMAEVLLSDDIIAYSVGGTPTDAVILGIFSVLEEKPDLVLSGFNIGENLSSEAVTTSGTVCAALEAASNGVPAIAVSVQVKDQGDKFDDIRGGWDFSVAISVTRRIVSKVIEKDLPPGVDLLNVNIPFNADLNTGIEVTRLARKVYDTDVEQRSDPRGRHYYWIDGGLITDADEGTDVHAVLVSEHISVTPLSLDLTARVDFNKVKELL